MTASVFHSRSDYFNHEPIADELVVLDLLYDDRWEWKVERSLHLPHMHSLRGAPYVSVRFNEYRVAHFLIAQALGERLLYRGLVQGKKHWGYTDDRWLTITDGGRAFVRETYEKLGVPYDFNFSGRLRSDRWYMEVK
jgi:hypothetical protein